MSATLYGYLLLITAAIYLSNAYVLDSPRNVDNKSECRSPCSPDCSPTCTRDCCVGSVLNNAAPPTPAPLQGIGDLVVAHVDEGETKECSEKGFGDPDDKSEDPPGTITIPLPSTLYTLPKPGEAPCELPLPDFELPADILTGKPRKESVTLSPMMTASGIGDAPAATAAAGLVAAALAAVTPAATAQAVGTQAATIPAVATTPVATPAVATPVAGTPPAVTAAPGGAPPVLAKLPPVTVSEIPGKHPFIPPVPATPAVATPAVATPAVATPAVATPAVATPAVATPAVATTAAATPPVAAAVPPPSTSPVVLPKLPPVTVSEIPGRANKLAVPPFVNKPLAIPPPPMTPAGAAIAAGKLPPVTLSENKLSCPVPCPIHCTTCRADCCTINNQQSATVPAVTNAALATTNSSGSAAASATSSPIDPCIAKEMQQGLNSIYTKH